MLGGVGGRHMSTRRRGSSPMVRAGVGPGPYGAQLLPGDAASVPPDGPRYTRRRRAVTTSDHKSCALIQTRLKLGDIMWVFTFFFCHVIFFVEHFKSCFKISRYHKATGSEISAKRRKPFVALAIDGRGAIILNKQQDPTFNYSWIDINVTYFNYLKNICILNEIKNIVFRVRVKKSNQKSYTYSLRSIRTKLIIINSLKVLLLALRWTFYFLYKVLIEYCVITDYSIF